jgi:hypothetical protein
MNVTLPGSETLAPSRIDEEDIRLTTGFADIFTAILLVVGGSILMAFPLFGGMGIVAAAFGLGWPLVQRRHFAACGNVLALGTALGAGLTFTLVHWSAGLIAASVASFFYWRVHRVPSALALTWICATGLVVAIGEAGFNVTDLWWSRGNAWSLFAGIVLFGGAMWYDSRDRLRQGRLSDVAFWLHLISAPLFVHGLFAALGMNPFLDTGISPAVVLGIFLALTLVSLAIDRRPLLASSFVYLVAATATLLRGGWQSGAVVADGGQQFLNAAMAPAVIGVLLLGLAAGWTPLRRLILEPMPDRLTEQLPPTARKAEPADDTPHDLPPEEKEPVRLVLGFNDFFVALGAGALFVGSIFVGVQLASMTAGGWMQMVEGQAILSAPMWLPILVPALAMWLVAEYFVRVRRMAWPAISAALWFSFTAWAAGLLAAFQYASAVSPETFPSGTLWSAAPLSVGLAIQCVLIASAVLLAANLLFWWRHRVPISFALAIAALVPLVFIDLIVRELTDTADPFASPDWAPRLLAAGAAVFALAMWWDGRDPARKTQRADTAFWLHLLAAALAIPAAYALTGVFDDTVAKVLVGAGFLGLVALALAIDRRAPLVVALPFALANTSEWIGNLAIVLALLALVLRWEQVRGLLLASLRPRPNFTTPPLP